MVHGFHYQVTTILRGRIKTNVGSESTSLKCVSDKAMEKFCLQFTCIFACRVFLAKVCIKVNLG